MRIDQALEKFIIQLQADGRSPHTIAQYRRHISLLACWASDVRPRRDQLERMGHEGVATFLASPVATGRAGGGEKRATSANCLRSSIKCFFGFCHRAGYIAQDPGRLIQRARCSPPPPRAISETDQRRLLAALAKARGAEAERDHLLFHLMLATGIRIGSAVALDVEDVDLAGAQVTVRRMKGDAPDLVFLNDAIRAHLVKFLADRSTGPLFFANGRRISKRHVQRRFSMWVRVAGITNDVSCHSLRHSFGQRIYNNCGDILLVKEAMQHKSVASTLVYARASEKRLRAAL